MAEALVPNRVQLQAFIVAEASLCPQQCELPLFMLSVSYTHLTLPTKNEV